MLGRARPTEPASPEARLIAMTAAIDQALAEADQAMRRNPGNRPLTDLCLDLRNTLGQGHTR